MTQVLLEQPVQLTLERLLEIRAQGLQTKSGQRVGTVKPAESTWTLTGIKDTELGSYPKLVQTMLAQMWLAHPKHRCDDMSLYPNGWDDMPPPLIDDNVGLPAVVTKVQKTHSSEIMPWD